MFSRLKSPAIGILLLLLCSGGCACLKKCCCWPRATPHRQCSHVEPTEIIPDLSLLPQALPPVDGPSQYCAITELNAQCLAARNSKTANLLVQEAEALETQRKCFDRGNELAQELLLLQAAHKRNLDAAVALQLLLRLAEAEAGSQNLERRLTEMNGMVSDAEELWSRGIAPPVSKGELESQRLALQHQTVEVRGTVERLNYQLNDALGVSLPPGSWHWPEVDLLVDPSYIHADEAVAVGLANRADLAALRMASRAEGREVVSAARILLQPLGIGMSTASSGCCLTKLLHLCSAGAESDVRSEQLQAARRSQELTVEQEVRQSVGLQSLRLSQIVLTRDRFQSTKNYLQSLEQQQQSTGNPPSVRKQRLDGLAVEQDLLHDVIEWKIAQVKLKEAQGLLAIECGYDAAARCR
jgi:hypothetical protein